jgi:hypothetical protein
MISISRDDMMERKRFPIEIMIMCCLKGGRERGCCGILMYFPQEFCDKVSHAF